MPVTPSAKKSLRRDLTRTAVNQPIRMRFRWAIRAALDEPSDASLAIAYRAIDRAAKKHVIHANRAARLKSRLMHKARGR